MKRRTFIKKAAAITATAGLLPSMGCTVSSNSVSTKLLSGKWSDNYQDAMVIDALAGPIQFNIPQSTFPLSASNLEQVRKSGITALNLTVNSSRARGNLFEGAVSRIATWEHELDAHPDVFTRIRNINDIKLAKQNGQLGIIYGFQDTTPFENELDRVSTFHGLGVRIVQLTYNIQNLVGSGCLVAEDTGLTDFGHEVVERLDALGMLVDLSHCGQRTTLEGIRSSGRPVSITHSGCNSIFKHPRNKDDATLRELANSGGVVGIYHMPYLNQSGIPDISHVVAHIEYALNLIGEEHVGIGSDQGIVPLDTGGNFMTAFEEVSASRTAAGIAAPREDLPPYIPELNHPQRMLTIAEYLSNRGHSARIIEKILGGNFYRLFKDVWV